MKNEVKKRFEWVKLYETIGNDVTTVKNKHTITDLYRGDQV